MCCGGVIFVINVYGNNLMWFVMEYVLEWYFVYCDELLMVELLFEGLYDVCVYIDVIGVNVFVQVSVVGFVIFVV